MHILSGKVQRLSDGTDIDSVNSKSDRENYRARIHLIQELLKSITIDVLPVRDKSQAMSYEGCCNMITNMNDELNRYRK